MESNKLYFDELIERIKQGDFKRIVDLREGKGMQIKFGNGVYMFVNIATKRAIINLFDNNEIDIEELHQLAQDASLKKARKTLLNAKNNFKKVAKKVCTEPKKTLWQKIFGK